MQRGRNCRRSCNIFYKLLAKGRCLKAAISLKDSVLVLYRMKGRSVEPSDDSGDGQSHPISVAGLFISAHVASTLARLQPVVDLAYVIDVQFGMHRGTSSRCALDLTRPGRALADDYHPHRHHLDIRNIALYFTSHPTYKDLDVFIPISYVATLLALLARRAGIS